MSIIKLWKNRNQILEGIKNSIFRTEDIEHIAEERRAICEANTCGYFNPQGDSLKCFIKGQLCCAACGCNLEWKLRSLSSSCGLKEIGRKPLWDAVLDEQEETKLKEKLGLQD
jgi:hypothetical protein